MASLIKDFRNSPETFDEPLAILPVDEVMEFIDEAVEKSYDELMKASRLMV